MCKYADRAIAIWEERLTDMKRALLKRCHEDFIDISPDWTVIREYYDELTETEWLVIENDDWPITFEWEPNQDRLPLKFHSAQDLIFEIMEIRRLGGEYQEITNKVCEQIANLKSLFQIANRRPK